MGVLDKFRPSKGNEAEEPVTVTASVNEKDQEAGVFPDDGSNSDAVTENAQHGVQTVEATTLAWSKKALVGVFIFMWLIYLTNGFQGQINNTLVPYASSEWESHSLIPVIGVVANCMTAAVYIPLSKILDLWGRAEGFLLMVLFATIGMIMMAASHNLPTYCAAYVFWQVGWSGLTYSIDVITADSTQLKNRGLAYAFTSSPYMITAFAGPKSAEAFLRNGDQWRWGFGTFSIVLPVVAAPLYALLRYNLQKAKKQGLLARESSGRSLMESIKWGLVEFDAAGAFLFAAGLVIFLLPFSIASMAPQGWNTPYIIAMIVLGVVLLCIFGAYERFVAPKPFLRFDLLTSRTVIGVCLLDFIYMIAYYCWNSYFTSFLQVVNNLPPSEAGYVSNTFEIVSGVLLFIVGYSMHKTGRFKWLLCVGIPLYIFAQGLMIHFRQPGQSIGYLVMCEVFISIAGATFILCMQVGILAAVEHQFVATALATLSVTGNIGAAVGGTISAAIWTNTFEAKLSEYLPAAAQENAALIAGDLDSQLAYEMGSPERLAIQKAYGYGQARMLGAGTGIMAIALVSLFLIKNYDLRKIKQTKGTVF
ncbi:major facilitator superfamily domain-containing protein [Fusarium flagelliforme]|uniref:Siderophore iron transporter mirb n=1 Tax=Fusarium flagelliforme TaxID=2675880 RepID=A0A395MXV3_9HYPO|nr:major facilitator superfamily domain-containing protein [Fusarium flagelliforme]KAH7174498.1 major facilitator superfamily domain-containing protein [Fusarium flagelliforme]RFN52746.1 siderophore iron transporter mirb [Fusarium flagelliforme]